MPLAGLTVVIYFNPLHHEGGDFYIVLNLKYLIISIHSTTRVETYSGTIPLYDYQISIHSTTRVETQNHWFIYIRSSISIHSTTRVETIICLSVMRSWIFQSTPPRGWRPGT